MFTKTFWKKTLERVVKSAAQGAITAGIGAATFDALHADWQVIGGGALSMAVLSALTCILTADVGPNDDPSAV